jgi:hypothetical protein
LIKNYKKIGAIAVTILLSFGLLNPNVFADSKKQLAHLVMEHEEKIKKIEEILSTGSNTSKATISDQHKTEIIGQFEHRYITWNEYEPPGSIYKKIVDYKISEDEYGYLFQVYFEGEIDWKLDLNDDKGYADGYGFARDMISDVTKSFNLYNGYVDVKFEFYDDGELVTSFVE